MLHSTGLPPLPQSLSNFGDVYLGVPAYTSRGVFASRKFAMGDLIVRDAAAPCPQRDLQKLRDTIVFDYYFCANAWFSDPEESTQIIFGLISFCNHSYEPNAVISWEKRGSIYLATLTAILNIEVGDEVVHHYSNIEDYVKLGKIPPRLKNEGWSNPEIGRC